MRSLACICRLSIMYAHFSSLFATTSTPPPPGCPDSAETVQFFFLQASSPDRDFLAGISILCTLPWDCANLQMWLFYSKINMKKKSRCVILISRSSSRRLAHNSVRGLSRYSVAVGIYLVILFCFVSRNCHK